MAPHMIFRFFFYLGRRGAARRHPYFWRRERIRKKKKGREKKQLGGGGVQSQASMELTVTIYRLYEFEMLELLEDNSYIICTSSDNACMLGSQHIVKVCQEWINGIVKKESRCRATLQHTRTKMN